MCKVCKVSPKVVCIRPGGQRVKFSCQCELDAFIANEKILLNQGG